LLLAGALLGARGQKRTAGAGEIAATWCVKIIIAGGIGERRENSKRGVSQPGVGLTARRWYGRGNNDEIGTTGGKNRIK